LFFGGDPPRKTVGVKHQGQSKKDRKNTKRGKERNMRGIAGGGGGQEGLAIKKGGD